MASKKGQSAQEKELKRLRDVLEEKWEFKMCDGVFTHIFGDPQATGAAIGVVVSFDGDDEDAEAVVELMNPLPDCTLPSPYSPAALKEVETTIYDLAMRFLGVSVMRFASGVTKYFRDLFPNDPSFIDKEYDAWFKVRKEVDDADKSSGGNSKSGAKASSSSGGGVTLSALEKAERSASALAASMMASSSSPASSLMVALLPATTSNSKGPSKKPATGATSRAKEEAQQERLAAARQRDESQRNAEAQSRLEAQAARNREIETRRRQQEAERMRREAEVERMRQLELEKRRAHTKARDQRQRQKEEAKQREEAREALEHVERERRLAEARKEMYSPPHSFPRPDLTTDRGYDADFVTYLETVYSIKSHMVQYPDAGLEGVPALIGHFDFVSEVNLSRNNLEFAPVYLLAMPSLRKLYLNDNRIKNIPSFMGLHWTSIQLIDLHNNQLTQMPDLTACTSLTALDLEKNQLREFPEGIEYCTNLYHLNLKRNQIKTVPVALGAFLDRKLSFLNLRNNPIVNLPPHIYQQGMKATLKFLVDHGGGATSLSAEDRMTGLAKSLTKLMQKSATTTTASGSVGPLLADIELVSSEGKSFFAHIPILFSRSTFFKRKIEEMSAAKAKAEAFSWLSSTTSPTDTTTTTSSAVLASLSLDSSAPNSAAMIFDPSVASIHSNSAYTVTIEPPTSVSGMAHAVPAPRVKLPILPLEVSEENLAHLLHFLYTDTFIVPTLDLVEAELSMKPETIAEINAANHRLKKQHEAKWNTLLFTARSFLLPRFEMLINEGFEPLAQKKSPDPNPSQWAEQFKALSQGPAHLFDVSFQCGDDSLNLPLLHAHKFILAARSPFLANLLTGHMIEASQRIVRLPDVSRPVMAAIIEFCYTDDVETLDPETIIELLTTAKSYSIFALQHLVESVVGYSLDVDNVSSILSIAWTHSMPHLSRACKFFVISNWSTVTSHPDWQSVDIAVKEKLHSTALKWHAISGSKS